MVVASSFYAIAQQPPTPSRVRGTIEGVVPADKSDLKAGARVIATMKKRPDGSLETNRVSVGRDGLTPPM
jgi:hypothetical protein